MPNTKGRQRVKRKRAVSAKTRSRQGTAKRKSRTLKDGRVRTIEDYVKSKKAIQKFEKRYFDRIRTVEEEERKPVNVVIPQEP